MAGVNILGLEVLQVNRVKWGTAIPTKDTGPAKAVTHADKILDNVIRMILKALILIPILFA